MNEKIIDGVKIIEDEDGTTHFIPIEEKKVIEEDTSSFWGKIKKWYDNLFIKPYIKARDLSDPFNNREDYDKGSDGKTGIEIGVKIEF